MDLLLRCELALKGRGIRALGLSLRYLDVDILNLASQLEDLVLDLADLQSIGWTDVSRGRS